MYLIHLENILNHFVSKLVLTQHFSSFVQGIVIED